MRVEHPKEDFHVVARLGNFEPVRVTALITKRNFELQFAHNEMKRGESNGKLLKKPAEHEEKRLARFDFVFELERFLERFPDRHELEQPGCFAGGPFPELNPDRSKAGRNRFLLDCRELA